MITVQKSVWDCSVMIISETWLHLGIPDKATVLAGRTAHHANRNSNSSKSRGGGYASTPMISGEQMQLSLTDFVH